MGASPAIPTSEAPTVAPMFGNAAERKPEDALPKLPVAKLLPPPSAPRPPQSFMAAPPPNPQPPAGPQSLLNSKPAAEVQSQEPPQRNNPFPSSFGARPALPSMASKPPPGQGGPPPGPPSQRHRPLPRPGGGTGPFGVMPGGGLQKLPAATDRARFGGPSPNQATSGGSPRSRGPHGGEERRGPGGGPHQMHAHPPGAGGQQRPPQQGGPNAFRGGPPGPPPGARPPQQQGGPPPPVTGGMRELRVEDALVYLDDVKREFGDRPRIYNEFLEIMKNFKSQEVDTPGVINRVSKLFRGYNNLILGFNKFLPDGYKISLEDLERQDAEYARQQQLQQKHQQGPGQQGHGYFRPGAAPGSAPPGHLMNQQREGPPGHQGPAPGAMQGQGYGQKRPPQGQGGQHQQGQPPMNRPGPKPQGPASAKVMSQQPAQGMPSLHAGNPPQAQRAPPAQQPPQQAPQHQAVEFDHAISYVTNIKKRFADDPNTYHQFLEILHTYQKEQRGIKEVLEQVASLFADHPDLLKEFTFFLPDAVQEQAKERLHRAAADSEARQALAAQNRMEQQGSFANRTTWGGPRGLENRAGPAGRRISSQKFIDMTGAQQMEASDAIEQAPAQPRQPASGRKRPFSPGRETQTHHPEAYVYNSAVERQFFEAAKEALVSFSRDGGQAWAEFLKCLDMYAQELLSKTEMLNFVDQILGKRNAELFEEFKRILSAAGSPTGPTPSMEDSWYSVPLSEIDFFRCRQCSTSYRALPRDYPAPPCSDRSEEEKKVLNDIWVSLPKGSEESYTFRHMRRNHCEEVLFRCEDERFEIDMVIDSNAATLRRLEPIADEIGQLAEDEKLVSDCSGTGSKLPNRELGLGGLRYQYTFDPTIFGVIHRNAITRIYGDAGPEMLELIVKNPSVAVPVIVQRLRQKDREWKSARERLNRHWKELAEMNYYKSLDHRSLTWRTIDKRATSTRTLVAEIKDRAANGGKEGDAALTARREKAKEEHGSFFAVTMGDKQEQDLDLASLPKPHPTIFTPQMSFMYDNNSWVQRDAYRILSFALERGSTSPADKERCHRLWRDLLGPLFGIPLSWMQKPAVAFQESTAMQIDSPQSPVVVSNGEENSHDDDDDTDDEELGKNVVTEELKNRDRNHDKSSLMDHHPLAAGTIVSTVYGEGRILRFRRSDKCYEIDLPFGTGYLRPNTVLCTVERVEQSAYTNQLKEQDTTKLAQKDDFLCFGTQSLYLFFRLHQILIRRLNIAKKMAYHVVKDQSLHTLVEQMKAEPNEDIGRKRYEAYLSLVYALVDGGQSDAGGKYEDRVRCLLGHGAYELATMDKLLSHILKNLQSISHDHIMLNLVALFRRHSESGFRPEAFKQEAAYLSEGDNMFAFQLSRVPETDEKVLHMEFLGVIYEEDENAQSVVEPEPEPAAKRPRVRA
jgi:paired amphipathic helix protein Sin3a